MTENDIQRLSDVIEPKPRQGLNDGYWSLMEHQIYEAQFALQVARRQMEAVGEHPENDEDAELAEAVLEILSPIYVRMLGANAAIKSLLAGTETAERIGGREDA